MGSVDGTEFPGGAAQDYTLELGSGSFIPCFEDQLLGAEVGKTVDVKVTFPADYGAPSSPARTPCSSARSRRSTSSSTSRLTMSSRKKNNFENLDAMRKAVAERIGQDYAQVSRTMIKRQLLDKLATPTSSRCPRAWSKRIQRHLAAHRGSQEGRP